jgi:hypothetical protein
MVEKPTFNLAILRVLAKTINITTQTDYPFLLKINAKKMKRGDKWKVTTNESGKKKTITMTNLDFKNELNTLMDDCDEVKHDYSISVGRTYDYDVWFYIFGEKGKRTKVFNR